MNLNQIPSEAPGCDNPAETKGRISRLNQTRFSNRAVPKKKIAFTADKTVCRPRSCGRVEILEIDRGCRRNTGIIVEL